MLEKKFEGSYEQERLRTCHVGTVERVNGRLSLIVIGEFEARQVDVCHEVFMTNVAFKYLTLLSRYHTWELGGPGLPKGLVRWSPRNNSA